MTPLTADTGLLDLLDAGESILVRTEPEAETANQFALDVARGLDADRKSIPSQYLYDAEGSALFEQICEQPEYYPTRTEAGILERYAGDIAAATGPASIVELGSGTSVKTQHILNAYSELRAPVHYVPIDVSAAALEEARQGLEAEVPETIVTGLVGTYDSAFEYVAELESLVVLFLGSTIGNFDDCSARTFWRNIAEHTAPGDHFLLGVDLVKDTATLEAAYNDAAGVTAGFTRNLFARMNRELSSGIDVSAVEHVATYNEAARQIEISARFEREQDIYVEPLDASYTIAAGEHIHTEISRKFRLETLKPAVEVFGFRVCETFTDERDWFALLLLERAGNG